jgi:hypothetical protein
MFRYLFGGAISTGDGESYINFLMAGIFIETAALTATTTVANSGSSVTKLPAHRRDQPQCHIAR